MDVSSYSAVSDLLEKVKVTYGGHVPNISVNCAGITGDSMLLKMTEKDFEKVMNVNLKVNAIFLWFELSYTLLLGYLG